MILTTALRCGLSGLEIGKLEVLTTAGALPYLSHWEKMQVRHPVFSLGTYKLLVFTKKEWDRLAKRVADEEVSDREAQILQVSYLACLHSFGSIKQDQPALPPLHIVQNTLKEVISLGFWKYTLDSKRFRFPSYHLSEFNENLSFKDINGYLKVCSDVRQNYAAKKEDLIEQDKIATARKALEALSREWVTPVSRKVLWQWVRSQLADTQYAADATGWLSTLFLGGGAAIVEFQKEDIALFEEIITSECEGGTGIMGAVRARIKQVQEIWCAHHETYEIDLEDYAMNNGLLVNGEQVAYPDPGPEPQARDFNGSKGSYFKAHAKWSIAKAAWDKQEAAKATGNGSDGNSVEDL